MRVITIVFLLLGGITAAAQDYAAIDAFARLVGPAKGRTVADLAKALHQPQWSERERVRSFYTWTCEHIRYDVDDSDRRFVSNEEIIRLQHPSKILKRGKAICYGYSLLMQAFCKEAGITCVVVEGESRDFHTFQLEKEVGHAWNAVFVDGQWGLIDATWGAGTVDELGNYERQFTSEFFLPEPTHMLETHYPADPMFQLLEHPVGRIDGITSEDSIRSLISSIASAEPDPTFQRYHDTIHVWLAMDSVQQWQNSGLRALRHDPKSAYGYVSLMQYEMFAVQQAARAYSEDVDAYNVAPFPLTREWTQRQYARFDVMEAGLLRCQKLLQAPKHRDYHFYELKYYEEQVPRLLKSYRTLRADLKKASKF
jgi:hypothetical protein